MGAKVCVLPLIAFLCALELFQADLRPFSRSHCTRPTDRRRGHPGMFFRVLLVFTTLQSFSLRSADSSPWQWEPICFVTLVIYECCGFWVLLLKIVANQAGKQSASPEPGEVARRDKAAATEGLFLLALLMFFNLSHEVVWAARSRPSLRKGRWL